jgi:hypothetical protein
MKLDELGGQIWRFRFTVVPYLVGVGAVVVTALLANALHHGAAVLLEHLGGDAGWSWHHTAYAVGLMVLLAILLVAWAKVSTELWQTRTRGQFGRRLASRTATFASDRFPVGRGGRAERERRRKAARALR